MNVISTQNPNQARPSSSSAIGQSRGLSSDWQADYVLGWPLLSGVAWGQDGIQMLLHLPVQLVVVGAQIQLCRYLLRAPTLTCLPRQREPA